MGLKSERGNDIRDTESGLKKWLKSHLNMASRLFQKVIVHWTIGGKLFDIVDYHYGGIHDFQDIVVLKPKK